MRRMVFIFLVAGFPVLAQAGAYSDAVDKQSRCESAGEFSKSSHGTTQEQLRSSVSDVQKMIDAKKVSKKLGGDAQYLILIGRSAKSAKDAYMQAWGWCMDQK